MKFNMNRQGWVYASGDPDAQSTWQYNQDKIDALQQNKLMYSVTRNSSTRTPSALDGQEYNGLYKEMAIARGILATERYL